MKVSEKGHVSNAPSTVKEALAIEEQKWLQGRAESTFFDKKKDKFELGGVRVADLDEEAFKKMPRACLERCKKKSFKGPPIGAKLLSLEELKDLDAVTASL